MSKPNPTADVHRGAPYVSHDDAMQEALAHVEERRERISELRAQGQVVATLDRISK